MSAMVHCDGCGFNVEREQVITIAEQTMMGHCATCEKCDAIPAMRESYRRGFNAGVDAMAEAVVGVIEKKNDMKRRP